MWEIQEDENTEYAGCFALMEHGSDDFDGYWVPSCDVEEVE